MGRLLWWKFSLESVGIKFESSYLERFWKYCVFQLYIRKINVGLLGLKWFGRNSDMSFLSGEEKEKINKKKLENKKKLSTSDMD